MSSNKDSAMVCHRPRSTRDLQKHNCKPNKATNKTTLSSDSMVKRKLQVVVGNLHCYPFKMLHHCLGCTVYCNVVLIPPGGGTLWINHLLLPTRTLQWGTEQDTRTLKATIAPNKAHQQRLPQLRFNGQRNMQLVLGLALLPLQMSASLLKAAQSMNLSLLPPGGRGPCGINHLLNTRPAMVGTEPRALGPSKSTIAPNKATIQKTPLSSDSMVKRNLHCVDLALLPPSDLLHTA
nr:hypothetical protein Iba_chr14fCG9550 [Ipomoea batatas]